MNNEKQPESQDEGNIEGGPTGIKIPVRRSDIGPYIKWLILAIAGGFFVVCVGFAISLVISAL